MRPIWLVPCLLVGCATEPAGPVGVDPAESGGDDGKADDARKIPDVRCTGAPAAGAKKKFRHFTSKVTAAIGSPVHRGFDLVGTADDDTQTLAGAISYGTLDKALEDEDVDVYACRAGSWKRVGGARTDDEGRFALALTGGDRLPVGMRDIFVSVAGDRTGARFLAYVAPTGTALIASDVDGTLTSSENAFLETIVLGLEPDARAGAADAYTEVSRHGYQMVYVTARGQQNMEDTRAWLEHKGFPRGPLRLAPGFITLPGSDTVDYKTTTLQALASSGLELAAGVGNRASDVTAYTNAGLSPDRIFIERPEFADEVQPELDAGHATGFDTYDELRTSQLSKLPAR